MESKDASYFDSYFFRGRRWDEAGALAAKKGDPISANRCFRMARFYFGMAAFVTGETT